MATDDSSREDEPASSESCEHPWREFLLGALGIVSFVIGIPLAAAAIVGFTRGSMLVLGACVLLLLVSVIFVICIGSWGWLRFRYLRSVSKAVESHRARVYGDELPTSPTDEPDRAVAATSANELLHELSAVRVPRGVRPEFTHLLTSVREFEQACFSDESLVDANVRIRTALEDLWAASPDRVTRFIDRHMGRTTEGAAEVETSS